MDPISACAVALFLAAAGLILFGRLHLRRAKEMAPKWRRQERHEGYMLFVMAALLVAVGVILLIPD